MWKSVASNALSLFVVLLVVVAGMLGWARREYAAPGPLSEAICLQVDRGASFRSVADKLAEQQAISQPFILRVGANYTDKSSQLKFGSYLIQPGASMAEIVDIITQGGQSTCGTEINFRIGVLTAEVVVRELDPVSNKYVELVKFDPAAEAIPDTYIDVAEAQDVRFRVTLAEGVTSWQVVESLKRAEFLAGQVADVPAEGSLAPDSYEVRRGTERAAVLSEMVQRQSETLSRLWAERADDLPYDTPEKALVMASIVEKETGLAEERGRVASVFVNRLRQGIRLQTDPTVIYGITKGQGALGRGLRQSELRRETPYNTYLIDGLPPTPIANPGESSIAAALNPEQTDYLFFVAKSLVPAEGHVFAATLSEHNENVKNYRALEAQQGSGN